MPSRSQAPRRSRCIAAKPRISRKSKTRPSRNQPPGGSIRRGAARGPENEWAVVVIVRAELTGEFPEGVTEAGEKLHFALPGTPFGQLSATA